MALMTGCATKAPTYQPSIDNVNTLKKTGNAVASVGTFDRTANRGRRRSRCARPR
jgi:hypothetical protein